MPTRRKFDFSFRTLVMLALLLAACTARAQMIERIDVTAGKNDQAVVVVHFSQKILYLRHVPDKGGKTVRIFLRLIEGPKTEGELMQEIVRAPKTNRVPDVSVTYPELKSSMLVSFSQRTDFSVRPGGNGRSIVITIPLLPGPPAAPVAVAPLIVIAKPVVTPPALLPAPSAVSPAPAPAIDLAIEEAAASPTGPVLTEAEVETRGAAYMAEARQALLAGDMRAAINRLNRVLGLPASTQTEPAQALIGEAREQNAEASKARAEYELYLKLFPRGANAPRVKKRLAALSKDSAASLVRTPLAGEPVESKWTLNGSLSVYKYNGKTQIETLLPPPPGELVFSRETLSLTDQNSLIASLNFNARRRDARADTRIVVRDTNNRNFLTPEKSYNRLYSAYIDHSDRDLRYQVRAGRQNPNGMGVLERFDGIMAGYDLSSQYRVNAVHGDAVEYGSDFEKTFSGLSVDLLPQAGRAGVSFYGIGQSLDGFANRRALGSEVRYFDGRASAFGTIDYDTLFKGVNVFLVQGNYLDESNHNYFFVLDHRKSPSYGLTNALIGAPGVALRDLISVEGIDTVRAQAKALTAESNLLSAGFTRTVSEYLQLGTDYRLSSISGTDGVVVTLPVDSSGFCAGTIDFINNACVITTNAQSGSGNSHVLSFQAIGNNLFVRQATGVANLSVIKAPTYTGTSTGLSFTLPVKEQWRLETNMRYYRQHDSVTDDRQDRSFYSLKLSYQWQSSFFLEAEMGREVSNSWGPTREDHTTRDYVFAGTRWDFH